VKAPRCYVTLTLSALLLFTCVAPYGSDVCTFIFCCLKMRFCLGTSKQKVELEMKFLYRFLFSVEVLNVLLDRLPQLTIIPSECVGLYFSVRADSVNST
jgi:hypothetical protein